jgi:hypothetical protein
MNYCAKCLKSESDCKCPNRWHSAVSADQLTEAPMYVETRCPDCDRLKAELAEVKRNNAVVSELIDDAVNACEWMQDDKSLGLKIGQTLTVKGVAALRKQRDDLRAELAAAMEASSYHEKLYLEAIAELAKLRALLSSARLAMRLCIPRPSCHSIDVIAQIDKAIGTAGVFYEEAAGRGEGER